MKYMQIQQGYFLERPNRFIALVDIAGKIEKCHVKNTGRCQELFQPGTKVWVDKSENLNRKTLYDLVAVSKAGRVINVDSQAPNQIVKEWLQAEEGQSKAQPLFSDITYIKPECKYHDSRIDFYIETQDGKKIFLEVKGVTLEEEGVARFPDAPTERGIKHMLELQKAVLEGYEAYILFVIQMKGVQYFEPNDRTHPQFGETLRQVKDAGVGVLAYDCLVTPEELTLELPIAIHL